MYNLEPESSIESNGIRYRALALYMAHPYPWEKAIRHVGVFRGQPIKAPLEHYPDGYYIGYRRAFPSPRETQSWRFAIIERMHYAEFEELLKLCPVSPFPGDGCVCCDGGEYRFYVFRGLCEFSLRWSGGPPHGWHALSLAIKYLDRLRNEFLPDSDEKVT